MSTQSSSTRSSLSSISSIDSLSSRFSLSSLSSNDSSSSPQSQPDEAISSLNISSWSETSSSGYSTIEEECKWSYPNEDLKATPQCSSQVDRLLELVQLQQDHQSYQSREIEYRTDIFKVYCDRLGASISKILLKSLYEEVIGNVAAHYRNLVRARYPDYSSIMALQEAQPNSINTLYHTSKIVTVAYLVLPPSFRFLATSCRHAVAEAYSYEDGEEGVVLPEAAYDDFELFVKSVGEYGGWREMDVEEVARKFGGRLSETPLKYFLNI